MRPVGWLRAHDPGFAALRRAGRTALVMPVMLAITSQVIGNPVMATFSAFGSFAMLLLVDFAGSIRDRLQAQVALILTCAVLIAVATLASRTAWVAAVVTAIIAFVVLFSGVVSSVLAGATTAMLLSFVLPVSLSGTVASIPDRVTGWVLAGLASLPAIALLWPAPERNPVRDGAVAACRALAARLRTQVAFVTEPEPRSAESEAAIQAAIAEADRSVAALQSQFFATPYRPTGLTSANRAIIRLVDELRWLNGVVLQSGPYRHHGDPGPQVRAVKLAAAEVLDEVSEALARPRADCHRLRDRTEELHRALAALEHGTRMQIPAVEPDGSRRADAVVSALDPTFRAQELSFIVAQIVRNTDYAAAAERRNWFERLLGRQPEGLIGPLSAASERAGAHLRRSSIWLHNSLRGSAGLTLAVLVADLSAVSHGFWVIFGALSVLRSNALSTGENVVRALLGTTAGFVVGAALVLAVGTNTAVLWALLPIVILIAGLAPAAVSFAAGQAAFTLTLLILFNILAPAGWRIGIVRIEDVALGGAVSLAVGVLFWPRGAAAALGRALADAYRESVIYLSEAVGYGIGRCDAGGPAVGDPRAAAARAAAAARRLDDAFRGYLSDRGSKPTPLAEVTSLVTGVAGVRLAADAVLELWDGDGASAGDRTAARRELESRLAAVRGWYERFAGGLTGVERVPDPLAADMLADERLVTAVGRDLSGDDGQGTLTGVRVIWTGDHLDAVRRLQDALVAPARAAAAEHAL